MSEHSGRAQFLRRGEFLAETGVSLAVMTLGTGEQQWYGITDPQPSATIGTADEIQLDGTSSAIVVTLVSSGSGYIGHILGVGPQPF